MFLTEILNCNTINMQIIHQSDQSNYRNDQNYYEFEAPEDDIPLYPDIVTNDVDRCSQELNVSQ